MTTEGKCLEALQRAADELGESPTKAQYEELGLTPSASAILRVVGGWNVAKTKADLETEPSSGSRTAPKPTDVELPDGIAWAELSQIQNCIVLCANCHRKEHYDPPTQWRSPICAVVPFRSRSSS